MNMQKKILTLIAVVAIGITATVTEVFAETANVSAVATQKIPAGIIDSSIQTGAWKDIYTSPKKVVVYSYKAGSTCPYQSQDFHNKVTAAASNANGAYYARPTGPEKLQKELNDVSKKLQAKSKTLKTDKEIKDFQKEIQGFDRLLKFTNQCTLKACIINPSKGEYILMSRDADEVVNTMRRYK